MLFNLLPALSMGMFLLNLGVRDKKNVWLPVHSIIHGSSQNFPKAMMRESWCIISNLGDAAGDLGSKFCMSSSASNILETKGNLRHFNFFITKWTKN